MIKLEVQPRGRCWQGVQSGSVMSRDDTGTALIAGDTGFNPVVISRRIASLLARGAVEKPRPGAIGVEPGGLGPAGRDDDRLPATRRSLTPASPERILFRAEPALNLSLSDQSMLFHGVLK